MPTVYKKELSDLCRTAPRSCFGKGRFRIIAMSRRGNIFKTGCLLSLYPPNHHLLLSLAFFIRPIIPHLPYFVLNIAPFRNIHCVEHGVERCITGCFITIRAMVKLGHQRYTSCSEREVVPIKSPLPCSASQMPPGLPWHSRTLYYLP